MLIVFVSHWKRPCKEYMQKNRVLDSLLVLMGFFVEQEWYLILSDS